MEEEPSAPPKCRHAGRGGDSFPPSFALSPLLAEKLKCSICLEVLTDPVTTPCGHSFCKTCLNKCWDNSQDYQCPCCKETFSNMPDLQNNTVLREAVLFLKHTEDWLSISDPLSEELKCSVCLDVINKPVTTPCGHNFCKSCLEMCWEKSQICVCPYCRETFDERPDLKNNTALSEIVQLFEDNTGYKREPIMAEYSQPSETEDEEEILLKPSLMSSSSSVQTDCCFYHEINLESDVEVRNRNEAAMTDLVEDINPKPIQKQNKTLEVFDGDGHTSEGDHMTHNTVPVEEESKQTMMKVKLVKKVTQETRKRNEQIKNIKMKMRKELQNFICLEDLIDPVTTPCGHIFCKTCLKECWEKSQICVCPYCRETFNECPDQRFGIDKEQADDDEVFVCMSSYNKTEDLSTPPKTRCAGRGSISVPPSFALSPLLAEKLQCSICLQDVIDPVTTPCGHSFCKTCLNECWEKNQICVCPCCKETFNECPDQRFEKKEEADDGKVFVCTSSYNKTEDLSTPPKFRRTRRGSISVPPSFALSPLLAEKLQCSICLEDLTDPVTTPCGHSFCKTCLNECWEKSQICLCPCCKETFSECPDLKNNTALSENVHLFEDNTVPVEEESEQEMKNKEEPDDDEVFVCTSSHNKTEDLSTPPKFRRTRSRSLDQPLMMEEESEQEKSHQMEMHLAQKVTQETRKRNEQIKMSKKNKGKKEADDGKVFACTSLYNMTEDLCTPPKSRRARRGSISVPPSFALSPLLPEKLKCSMCLEVLTDPVTTLCGHSFCKTCLNECWDNSQDYQCPCCKETFRNMPDLQNNTVLREAVLFLKHSKDWLSISDPLSEELKCSVCLDVINKPVTTPCGHNFCKSCLEMCWEKSHICVCPYCRETFDERPDLKNNTALCEIVQLFEDNTGYKREPIMTEYSRPSQTEDEEEILCKPLVMSSSSSVQTDCCFYHEINLESDVEVRNKNEAVMTDLVEDDNPKPIQKQNKTLEVFDGDGHTSEGDHMTHNTVPVEEGSEQKMKVKLVQKMTQETRKRIKQIKNIKMKIRKEKKTTKKQTTPSSAVT